MRSLSSSLPVGIEAPNRPPRRFRRRLLGALFVCALGPLLLWGWLSRSLLDEALSLVPPLGPVLARSTAALERDGTDPALVEQLRRAEIDLVQTELLRRGLQGRGQRDFLLALGATVVVVVAAALVLGSRLSRPIERLTLAMGRYARGELGHQVPVAAGGGDELDFLGRQLNRMGTEPQQQRARLQTTETIAAWRDVARVMAHDLKNPLTAMRMALGRLARPERTEAAEQESVSLLQEELSVLIRMTQSFSDFAHLPQPTARRLDLRALIDEVAALYQESSGPNGIQVSPGSPILLEGDADQLRRALGNLIKNAVEASRADSGPIVVSLAVENGQAVVRVRDHGVGLARPLEGDDLIRGLASTKASSRGLGLPIAHTIVHAHGGRLRLVPATPGAEAEVVLPVSGAVAPSRSAAGDS